MDNYGDVDDKVQDTLMKQVSLMYNFVRDVSECCYSKAESIDHAHRLARQVRKLARHCPYYPKGVIHE